MKRLAILSGLLFTTLAVAAADSPGAALYRQKACHTCHAADGSGNTPVGKSLKARDLRSAEVQQMSDAELTTVIADGRGKMPAYKSSLNGEQIQELVKYIRSLAK